MFKRAMMFLSIPLMCVVGACSGEEGSEDAPSTDDDMSQGEALYQNNNCVGCHGGELEGASGPNLQNVGNRLSPDEIEEVITEGRGQMPGGLIEDEEELDAIVEWLSSQTEE